MTDQRPHSKRSPWRHSNGHVNWPAVHQLWVEGDDTPDEGRVWLSSTVELAAATGIRRVTLGKRMRDEGWDEERAAFQQRIRDERRNATVGDAAKLAARIDGSAMQISNAGLTLVRGRLGQISRAMTAQEEHVRAHPGTTIVVSAVDAQEMERLGRAAKLLHEVGMASVGEPSDTDPATAAEAALRLLAPHERRLIDAGGDIAEMARRLTAGGT